MVKQPTAPPRPHDPDPRFRGRRSLRSRRRELYVALAAGVIGSVLGWVGGHYGGLGYVTGLFVGISLMAHARYEDWVMERVHRTARRLRGLPRMRTF